MGVENKTMSESYQQLQEKFSEFRKNYFDLADTILPESKSTQELIDEVRRLRDVEKEYNSYWRRVSKLKYKLSSYFDQEESQSVINGIFSSCDI